jgi:hypothetical protein
MHGAKVKKGELFSPQNTDLTEYLDGYAVRSVAVVAQLKVSRLNYVPLYL